MHLFRIGVVASKGCAEGVPSGCYTENNNIFSPSKQRDICVLVYVVAQRFHCLCVWVCHRFYFTDYFSPLPFSPSPPPLSLVLRVFVLLHWLVYFPFGFDAPRAMWLWLWLGAAAFRQSVWLFTFSTCKTKGGTRKLSFAGGRKSNGTRAATLAQPSAWKGVNKCAGNSSGNVFYFLFLFSALLCFNETERNFSASRFDFDWISKYIFSLSLSLFFENNIKLCPLLEK